MSKPKRGADVAEVLFANEAFYDAFRLRDLSAMEELWAREAEVACIHPGWPALYGREAVLKSWSEILANPDAPEIACRSPRAFVGGDAAFVICYELLGRNVLVASNLFVREGGAWRMTHHHAGPCNVDPAQLGEPPPAPPLQ